MVSLGKYLAGGLQSGCTANLTGAQYINSVSCRSIFACGAERSNVEDRPAGSGFGSRPGERRKRGQGRKNEFESGLEKEKRDTVGIQPAAQAPGTVSCLCSEYLYCGDMGYRKTGARCISGDTADVSVQGVFPDRTVG